MMQLKSMLVIALAAACCATATARKKKTAKAEKPAAEQLKPVDGATFSYAIGVVQGTGLKDYLVRQGGVDSAYVKYAIEAMNATLPEAEVKQKLAYAAGLRVAEMNQRNLKMFNKEAVGKEDSAYVVLADYQRGLSQVVLGQPTTLTTDSATKIVEQQAKYQRETYKNLNAQFLANNKQAKDVKVLPSGLQYQVVKQGTGRVATDSTEVEVHYEGKLIDGTVFDSSYERKQPATFRPNQVIAGWREALKLMPEGSVWNLYIPAELGYGERGNQRIPGNSTLIFRVEVIKVKDKLPAPAGNPIPDKHKEITTERPQPVKK